jgi:hypothetical protein
MSHSGRRYNPRAVGALLVGSWIASAALAQDPPSNTRRATLGAPVSHAEGEKSASRIVPVAAEPVIVTRPVYDPPAAGARAYPTQLPPLSSDQPAAPTLGQPQEHTDKAAPANEACKPFWQTHPRYPVLPKLGFFLVPPSGPGYYSLRDVVENKYRQDAPPYGYNRFGLYPFGFFDADFRYVDDPQKNKDVDFFEKLHRIHFGHNNEWLFGTGGEFTYRMFNEINSRGVGIDNRYDLTRLRLFGDLWYKDSFRIYVEGISAQSFNQNLKPLVADRDYFDLLNAFVDVKVFQDDSNVPWYVRAGRQQLAFGSQRLVSPLIWANTMRTFEGVSAFRHGDKFDADLFWVQPVIPNAGRFDSVDREQNFTGAWTTYRPDKNTTLDLYYLFLDNNNKYKIGPISTFPGPISSTPFSAGPLAIDGPYNVHTLGTRFSGDYHNFLYDVEPMLQLGARGSSSIIAGATASGVGWHFKDAPWNPIFWAYYDWASGSRNPLAGQLSTFNQLYPFGHWYFGWMDFVGRQNIQDYNFNLYLNPTKWITFNTQYHIFQLASATDALYNPGGQPLRFDPTGRAGRDVGQELDFVVNFHLTRHQDILFAYGHMFFGDFMRSTGPGSGAESYWLLYNVRW